jgi:alkaline phosphatase D
MIRERADFVTSIGDNVYYDFDLPMAMSVDIARFHWQRMYSQPLLMELFRNTPCYWLKDDHDSCEDDNWATRPSQRVGPMTYKDLAPVFQEQMPIGPSTYRQVRHGKGLELWFLENRDFRSPNWDPDGPQKTIWGPRQKEWLQRTLLASDADFRILVSPNCIVGPDPAHGSKFELPMGGADSHCDGGFGFEGSAFRRWVKANGLKNLIVLNGDRHWQYHSVDPETGLREFCCGGISDRHSVKNPVHVPSHHRFLRGKGGYVSMVVTGTKDAPLLDVRFHDVDGNPVHEVRIRRDG